MNTVKTVQEAVAEKISGSNPFIANVIIDQLAEVEIKRRADMLLKAVKVHEKMEKDFNKINRADIKTYDSTGTPVESMSENRFKEIKQSKEKLDKLTNSINDCLTLNTYETYQKLEPQLNVGGSKEQGGGEGKQ